MNQQQFSFQRAYDNLLGINTARNRGPPINPPFPSGAPVFGPLPPVREFGSFVPPGGLRVFSYHSGPDAIQPTMDDYRRLTDYLISEVQEYRLRYGFLRTILLPLHKFRKDNSITLFGVV